MKIKLPKRFYTPEQLAERWECKVEDISHLIETGELKTREKLAAGKGAEFLEVVAIDDIEDITRFYNRLRDSWAKTDWEGCEPQTFDDWVQDTHYEFPRRSIVAADGPYKGLTDLEILWETGAFDRVIMTAEVARYERKHGEPTEDTAPPPSCPWGDYETPLLRILAESVNHFCLDGPDRYPKKDCGAVVNWIKARMEANGMPASDQLAGAMETLIAPRPYIHHRQRKQK